MSEWQVKKNRIDMDYQQALQKYQVLLASKWAIPLGIFGLVLQSGLTGGSAFLWGGTFAYFIFIWFDDQTEDVKKDLANFKRKVSRLNVSD